MIDDNIRLIRLRPRDLAQLTIVVRVGKLSKLRLLAAIALMKLAARVGRFKRVAIIRERER
jgi:hypothetical protein